MQDIKLIRENPDNFKEVVKNKGLKLDVDELLKVEKEKNELIQKVDELRSARKKAADSRDVEEGKKIKEELSKIEPELRKLEEKFNEFMLLTPQIQSEDTPIGSDEAGNKVVREVGDKPEFDFKFKDHMELAKDLDLIDFERGVKVSGFRGYFLKNEAALLQMALMQHGMSKMVEAGFVPVIPPAVVREFTLYGTGYFPFGQGDNYEIANVDEQQDGKPIKDKMYFAGTAEVGIGAYHSDETLDADQLPLKYVGFNSCFRREIGSYGRDTKGIYRIHEFMKIEQFVLCENDYKISDKWHQEMVKMSESILQDLELPYRLIQMCTGDMGAGKYKMFDIETWMPSRESYGETHSASNLGDWQARRMNIKYKDGKGKKQFVHTLNNTAIASPRILIALLEINQQKDGSIKIPKALWPYMFGIKEITPKK